MSAKNPRNFRDGEVLTYQGKKTNNRKINKRKQRTYRYRKYEIFKIENYHIIGPLSQNHPRRMNLTGRRYLARKTDLK